MPYRNAPYYVLFCIAVIAAGFWPSYFALWTDVPWQFHAHGVASSLWVILVLTQSWTAHHKQFELHRASGKASLLLFPFLIAGLGAIIDVTAKGYVAGDGPARMLLGGQFLIGLIVAMAAYVTLYYRALKFRRKVWIHAGYMLGTPLILFESPFGRIINSYVPGLIIHGPEDLWLIMPAILISDALAIALCLVVWTRVGERGRPFLVTGGFIALQMVTMSVVGSGGIPWSALAAIGNLPSSLVWATCFAIGAATSWIGWQSGKRPAVPVSPPQAA